MLCARALAGTGSAAVSGSPAVDDAGTLGSGTDGCSPLTGPTSGRESVLLRTMPLLLMALVLLVWQYG